MARGTRSRASRAERRLQKERSANALDHGLPESPPLPQRGFASAAAGARRSSHPPGPGRLATRDAANQRLPLSIKLLGLGLGLLGLVYGLTLFRDHKSRPASTLLPVHSTSAVK